jgi:hypothetical protein
MACNELNISIPEFTVAGVPVGNFFGHEWFVASDDSVHPDKLQQILDEKLKLLNDDYEVERKHALQSMTVEVLPESVFLRFMESKGKIGGQHKFPRVLKGSILEDWRRFLSEETRS